MRIPAWLEQRTKALQDYNKHYENTIPELSWPVILAVILIGALGIVFANKQKNASSLKQRSVATSRSSNAAQSLYITLRLTRTWQIKLPPPKKKMVAGILTLNPRSLVPGQAKKRQIAIEIYGHEELDDESRVVAEPDAKTDMRTNLTRSQRTSKDGHLIDLCTELRDDDLILIRVLKRRRGRWGFARVPNDDDDDDRDDHSSASESDDEEDQLLTERQPPIKKKTIHTALLDNSPAHATSPSNLWKQRQEEEWIECKRFNLESISEERLMEGKHALEATFGLGNRRQRRDIFFATDKQAQEFYHQLQGLRDLVTNRAKERLQAYKFKRAESKRRMIEAMEHAATTRITSRAVPTTSMLNSLSTNMDEHTQIRLLVEIVSAQDLPVADANSTDPYLSIYLGPHKIHRTKTIHNDLNPVWTVETGSLFLVDCLAEEFFSYATGLLFRISDADHLSKNEIVGHAALSQMRLLQMNGNRTSIPIEVSPNMLQRKNATRLYAPKLNIRVRKAMDSDIEFIKQLDIVRRSKKEGIYANASFVAPTKHRVGLLHREVKKQDGVEMLRANPRPDPTRDPKETEWMTADQLEEEMMKPSYEWIEAGTGSLGKMYVEVLKCDGLPNLDAPIPGATKKGQTDAFCCLIYEDAIVNTDVIRDDLNPRWVPWCERAFVFRMGHPSSQILIGVFDYDVNHAGIGSHDPVGRITVDVTNFSPSTEYVLSYHLYESVLDNVRESRGTLTIRLRIEYDNFQDFSLGSLKMRPSNTVHVTRRGDFRVAYFTCNGEENTNRFKMEDLMAYRTELESLVGIKYFIRQAVMTVVLWRGHKEVNLFGWKLRLPLHSVFAFVMATTLIENYDLYPSYCFFSIAWLLAATNEERVRHPSPWRGSLTIAGMWYAVLSGKTMPVEISEHENEAAIRAYEEKIEQHFEMEREKLLERQEAAKALSDFLQGGTTQPEAITDENETKTGHRSINPLAIVLLPIQQILGQVCRVVRIIRSVLTWDESHTAFILWNVCIALGVACLWVPWSFFTRWLLRILAWTLLGPWMKLVDFFVLPKLLGAAVDEDEALQNLAKTQLANLGLAKEAILKQREKILKERAMKKYMFGRFSVKVPRFKEFRYRDTPLPESYATSKIHHQEVKIKRRSHGQTLEGDMVPTWGDAIDEVINDKKKI